jgi:hypothetical protein
MVPRVGDPTKFGARRASINSFHLPVGICTYDAILLGIVSLRRVKADCLWRTIVLN